MTGCLLSQSSSSNSVLTIVTVVDQALLIVEEVPPVSKGRCNFEVNTARRSRWPNFWQGLKTLWRAVGIGDSTGLPVGQARQCAGRI